MLWFDVEERYNTTDKWDGRQFAELWFDVEERYNTTENTSSSNDSSCGLM